MTQPQRPKDCPLFLHRNRQWSKKIRGKLHYFGTDLDAALKRWADEKDHLLAGYDPPRKDGKPTIAELTNLYLAECRERAAAGDVRDDMPSAVQRVLKKVIGAVGRDAKPDIMRPAQWQDIRHALGTKLDGKPAAKNTLSVRLNYLRAFVNWMLRRKLVKEVDAGDALQPPAKRLVRRERAAKGKRLWQRDDLLKAIDNAHRQHKPVLLLGINGAMGSYDIAELKRSQWKAGQEFLRCPRNKTGIDRTVWLWQETRDALAAAVETRAEPNRQKYRDRLLLTKTGQPWVSVNQSGAVDQSAKALRRLIAQCEIRHATHYDMRRTFRTIAGEVCDLEATDHIMGHSGRGQGSVYVQEISDERVRRVCEYVRGWLFG